MTDVPILICYDGTADSERAIETAQDLLGPRRAVVLNVGPTLTTAESFAAMSSVVPGTAFEELNVDDARRLADAGAERARHAGFEAEARGEVGAPTWEGILDVADEIDASVIVLGSRRLKGLREWVEGSVSHELAQHSRRPVLIVPPVSDS